METRITVPPRGRRPERRGLYALVLRAFALLLVASLLPPILASPASAQGAIPQNVLDASVMITVRIEVTPENGDDPFFCSMDGETEFEAQYGSGTIITEDGHVLTNHHVTVVERLPRTVRNFCEDQADDDADVDFVQIAWLPDERGIPEVAYRVELVEDTSSREDLAILQLAERLDGDDLDETFPFVEFGDSDALREPETLFIIGYPGNAGPTRKVSEGIFSGWGDNGYGVEWIYTDATISGGNSGGTAVNAEGQFVGIPTQATASDCRPGDTNLDGVIDENDGCIGIGGNYGILIPSNIAREFAQDVLDREFEVVQRENRGDDPDPTPTPDDRNADGPPFGDISFNAYDAEGNELDSFQNVHTLEGCFENLNVEEGQEGIATWYLNDESYLVTEFVWDDAWNPEACASIWVEEEGTYLEPGTYRLELETDGQTVVSDDVEVIGNSLVDSVTFEGRTTDGDRLDAEDGVLEGEFDTLYADIAFTGMEEGSIWEVEWYLDGDLIFSLEPEAWTGDEDDTETVRLRRDDDEPLVPGTYEIVVIVDDEEAGGGSVTIED